MKKALSILLLTVASLSAVTAQTEKGRWTVGASVGSLSYQDQNSFRTFSANLTPLAGYFIANGLVIGTGVPVSLLTSKSTSASFISNYTTTGIGLSPTVQYYVGQSALKPYIGLSYSYIHLNRQYVTPTGDASGKGYSTILAPTIGIAYFINRNVALNVGLNYNVETEKSPSLTFSGQSSPAPTVVTFNSESKSLSLNIGFQLFFGK